MKVYIDAAFATIIHIMQRWKICPDTSVTMDVLTGHICGYYYDGEYSLTNRLQQLLATLKIA